jgi:hypothetical protein
VARNDAQYRTWLEFIGEVLKQPLGVSAQYEDQLLELLAESFNGVLTTRNTVTPEWENKILACWPRNCIPSEIPREPPGGYDFRQQPLLRWYAMHVPGRQDLRLSDGFLTHWPAADSNRLGRKSPARGA